MQKSPVKDIDVNIPPRNYGPDEKFRDMRHRAKTEEESARYKKMKRSKKERDYKYRIGDVFVAIMERWKDKPKFYLVEVFDYAENGGRIWSSYAYYCILKMTTDPEMMDRIGRIVRVQERTSSVWRGEITDANVENKGIKWLIA